MTQTDPAQAVDGATLALTDLATRLEPQLLVGVGAVCLLSAFLIKDQVKLWALAGPGNGFYCAYCYFGYDAPLWQTLAASAIMLATNAVVIVLIRRRRRAGALRPAGARLDVAFEAMAPGDVRRMMRLAEMRTAERPTVLTRLGHVSDELYFVLDGAVEIARVDRIARVERAQFIGELGFLLGSSASATVTLAPGARYLAWNAAALRALMAKREPLARALDRAFTRDIANKLRAPDPGSAVEAASRRLGVVAA